MRSQQIEYDIELHNYIRRVRDKSLMMGGTPKLSK